MYIDTHTHLQFSVFDSDRSTVIGNAKKAGVKIFVVPGVDEGSSKAAISLATRHKNVVYASVGFHPYEAQHEPSVSRLETLIDATVVAVGECGLDYHTFKGHDAFSKKDNQKKLFEAHLRLAIRHDLPVIMHCRDAFEDFFGVIDSLPKIPSGVIHCFTGSGEDLRFAQTRNFFIGIDGNATYDKHLLNILPQTTARAVLLETDSPYLTPVPHRGERNEPKHIPLIAKRYSEITHTPLALVQETTTLNAKGLFHIG